ncbi:hypothetical protein [Haloparvum sp. PAK95]|uniref:hypothetical protein n=1 Tax=Haloparvum sp. PAK95 TaxID=3418962 RepID=UPI003D2EC106
MPTQLSLADLSEFSFATNDQLARIKAGRAGDDMPDQFTALYHRNGGEEKTVMVRDVHGIERSPVFSPLQEEGFETLARLLVDRERIVTIGETTDGEIFRLSEGPESPSVQERVELRTE